MQLRRTVDPDRTIRDEGGRVRLRGAGPSVATSVVDDPVPGGLVVLADVPVVDVAGDALRLVLGRTEAPAVASRTWSRGPWTIVAEVLAASHRMTACAPGREAIETVACDVGSVDPVDASSLPRRHVHRAPTHTATFSSEQVSGHHAVRALAARLRADAGRDDHLVVSFPGHPDALTAVHLEAPTSSSLAWRTWHLYPGRSAHAVVTTTTLEPDLEP